MIGLNDCLTIDVISICVETNMSFMILTAIDSDLGQVSSKAELGIIANMPLKSSSPACVSVSFINIE